MVVHLYTEQTDSGKEFICLKRDWIRGLIYSYARPEPKTLLGTRSDLDSCIDSNHT
jgi:hypothetical protein